MNINPKNPFFISKIALYDRYSVEDLMEKVNQYELLDDSKKDAISYSNYLAAKMNLEGRLSVNEKKGLVLAR